MGGRCRRWKMGDERWEREGTSLFCLLSAISRLQSSIFDHASQKLKRCEQFLRQHIAQRGIALPLRLVLDAVLLAEILDADDDFVAHLKRAEGRGQRAEIRDRRSDGQSGDQRSEGRDQNA